MKILITHPSPDDMAETQLDREELVAMLFKTLGETPWLAELLGPKAPAILHDIVAPALQGYFAGGVKAERARMASMLTARVDVASEDETDRELFALAGELLASLEPATPPDEDEPAAPMPSQPPLSRPS